MESLRSVYERLHALESEVARSTNEWGGWGHENSQLEIVSQALEGNAVRRTHKIIPKTSNDGPLRECFLSQCSFTRIAKGLFRRSPNDPKQNSHDNFLALLIGSWFFKLKIAEEIVLHGVNVLGLWITGPKYVGGTPTRKWDSEWFVWWRPEYRAYGKLATESPMSFWEYLGLVGNLWFSHAYNMQRVKLLFLTEYFNRNPNKYPFLQKLLPIFKRRLGTHYKGRYGDNPYYLEYWKLNGDGYGEL